MHGGSVIIGEVCGSTISKSQWETFWDDRGQQTYRVNPLFSELCACSELRKQWEFTRYVCCRLALESLLLTYLLSSVFTTMETLCFSFKDLFRTANSIEMFRKMKNYLICFQYI